MIIETWGWFGKKRDSPSITQQHSFRRVIDDDEQGSENRYGDYDWFGSCLRVCRHAACDGKDSHPGSKSTGMGREGKWGVRGGARQGFLWNWLGDEYAVFASSCHE